jgi:RHS repeat-associated protein
MDGNAISTTTPGGHCTLQTDTAGNIVAQYEYDAFGQPYFYDSWGNNIGYSPWGNRFLFTGREYLSDLKLYDYRNRMYQPQLGRFMQPDPKEFGAGDYNLYRYCHNDPVNKSDPLGLIDREIDQQIDGLGAQASRNSLQESLKHKDGTDRQQLVQEKDGRRSLQQRFTAGKEEKRREIDMKGTIKFRTRTYRVERSKPDEGHKVVAVGHVHMDKTGKPPSDSAFSTLDYDKARGSRDEPGIPVYKVNESNPAVILRLTPQVDYHDEPTIRPIYQ